MNGCAIIKAMLRFEKKLARMESGCRVWTGAQTKGGRGRCKRDKRRKRKNNGPTYGKFWVGPDKKDTVQAHVFAAFVAGKIKSLRVPAGMHLDHDCHHGGSLCVDCTELVPAEVNLERVHTRRQPKVALPARPKRRRCRCRTGKRTGNPVISRMAKKVLAAEGAPA